jgi:hypothetical protein
LFLFSLLSFSRSALCRTPATPQPAETATEAATTLPAAIMAPAVTTAQVGVTAAAKAAAVEDRQMQARTIMVTRALALWPALPVH